MHNTCVNMIPVPRWIVPLFLFPAAYEVLSDKEKRKHYDQFGEEEGRDQGFQSSFNFNEFFQGFDEHFRHQRQHHGDPFHHHHQNTFRFSGGNFFNFDDLFDDVEEDIFSGFHFNGHGARGAANANAKVNRGGMHFDFGNFFDDPFQEEEDMFGGHYKYSRDANQHFQHHQHHHQHQHHNGHHQNIHSFSQSHNSGELVRGGGQSWFLWWWQSIFWWLWCA